MLIKIFGYAEECVSVDITWLITLIGEEGPDQLRVLGTLIYCVELERGRRLV